MTKPKEWKGWAVIQKSHELEPDDVFYSYGEAAEYKRDCFEPEHEAKIVRVTILITALKPKKV